MDHILKTSYQGSFLRFIWNERVNRKYLLIAIVGTIGEFFLFKLCYPFPDFFSDSYSYLFAAQTHLDVSIWPIGYSKFLSAFHALTASDRALIAFQYFFLELSAGYFFFTILYWYQPKRFTANFLFLFLFFNPLFLYLANYINSDPLFAALSLLWLGQLLWIVRQPRLYMLFTQAVLLFLCFTVRNNAYYYPIVAIVAFSLSELSRRVKLAGMVLPFLFIIPFILYTRNAAYKMTGTHQFSLFTGWQLANNALYFRDKVETDSSDFPTAQSRELDKLAGAYFKRVKPEVYRDYLDDYVGNFFIRQPEAPLKQYLFRHYKITDEYSSVVTWGKASAVFADYGSTLIRQHPLAYLQYYGWLNAKDYLLPPLEKLEIYNIGMDSVEPVAQRWFNWKNPAIHAASKGLQGVLLFIFPPVFLLLNLYFFWQVLGLLWRGEYRQLTDKRIATQVLLAGFLLLNMGFTILATINVFRYQFVPLLACLSFCLLMMEYRDEQAMIREQQKKSSLKPTTKLQPKIS